MDRVKGDTWATNPDDRWALPPFWPSSSVKKKPKNTKKKTRFGFSFFMKGAGGEGETLQEC